MLPAGTPRKGQLQDSRPALPITKACPLVNNCDKAVEGGLPGVGRDLQHNDKHWLRPVWVRP